MPKPRLMLNMTVKDVRDGLNEMRTVVVPIGVTEQHGYHLPLSVDIHNAVEIAARASERTGVFVAPALHYCFSGGTLPGTINLSPQVFSLVLMDICRSLAAQGFANIILLLGHGGTENTQAAKDAALGLQRLDLNLGDVAVCVVPFWELSPTYLKSFAERDFHAGKYETSMMLYWKPELVKMNEAAMDAPDFVERMRSDPDAYLTTHKAVDSDFVMPKLTQSPEMSVGVMGDFTGANAELGKQIAEECAAGLAAFVEKLEGRL